jgi:hypothetical protein
MMYSESIRIASNTTPAWSQIVLHPLQFVTVPCTVSADFLYLTSEMLDSMAQVVLQVRLGADIGARAAGDAVVVCADVHQGVLSGSGFRRRCPKVEGPGGTDCPLATVL